MHYETMNLDTYKLTISKKKNPILIVGLCKSYAWRWNPKFIQFPNYSDLPAELKGGVGESFYLEP
jgi:hypothetical protein